jgi:hypothetical protein
LDLYRCQQIFRHAYSNLRKGPIPEIQVEYYPYSDLNHTIRLRHAQLWVRLSDIAVDASEEVVEALAYILLGRLMRKRVNPSFNAIYRQYASLPAVVADIAHTRAERARAPRGHSEGRHYDLNMLFKHLNARYFSSQLGEVQLRWSPKRSLRRLGYYRQAANTIVISKALDDPRVPIYVTEFILYHEMLHAFMPTIVRNGRRYDHTAQFRAAERHYEQYGKADSYLKHWPPKELRIGRMPKPSPHQRWLF